MSTTNENNLILLAKHYLEELNLLSSGEEWKVLGFVAHPQISQDMGVVRKDYTQGLSHQLWMEDFDKRGLRSKLVTLAGDVKGQRPSLEGYEQLVSNMVVLSSIDILSQSHAIGMMSQMSLE